jgi:serine/threonine protein kinase
VPWSEKFPDADPLALDLMDKMLQFHPGKRIDVATALKHPWLAQLHDETQEPAAPGECKLLQPNPSTCLSRPCHLQSTL